MPSSQATPKTVKARSRELDQHREVVSGGGQEFPAGRGNQGMHPRGEREDSRGSAGWDQGGHTYQPCPCHEGRSWHSMVEAESH